MREPLNPVGNYQIYLYEETNMLTNCILALANYRKEMGEYWPSFVIISRNNRLQFKFGEGVNIRRGGMSDNWIINNALYISTDKPLRDPAYQRKATVLQTGKRQPVEDVYQQVYRFRNNTAYLMTLPSGEE